MDASNPIEVLKQAGLAIEETVKKGVDEVAQTLGGHDFGQFLDDLVPAVQESRSMALLMVMPVEMLDLVCIAAFAGIARALASGETQALGPAEST